MSEGNEGSEPPTEHRLQEARKRGDTPQSADLSHAVATLLWSMLLIMTGATALALLARYITVLLVVMFGHKQALPLGWAGVHLGIGLGVVCAVGLCIALLPELMQSRGRWATRRTWFDMNRLNPIQRLKSVFAMARLLQLPLAFVRFAVVAAVAWVLFTMIVTLVHRVGTGPWYGGYLVAWWASVRLLAFSSVVCLGIGLLDAWLQKVLWHRRNRMKKDDVQKEYKEQEGDPAIKGLRRQLHQESVG